MVALLLLLSSFVHAETLSMTVGRVDDLILTSREVQMQVMMEKYLFGGVAPEKLRHDALDSGAFFNHVNDALLERALALEAKSFDVVQLDGKTVKDYEKKIQAGLTKSPSWSAMEPGDAEWRALLERKIRAKQFIKFRQESSNLPVTDVEAKRYFEENRLKFGELPFENFKENIKSYLARSQVDRRLKDWYEVVKAKYKAKNLLSEL